MLWQTIYHADMHRFATGRANKNIFHIAVFLLISTFAWCGPSMLAGAACAGTVVTDILAFGT
jgi:hypothetical protein